MSSALLLLSLSMLTAPEPQRGEEVEELISKGVQLRESQRDSEALHVFRKAYELSQGARALAQLALAEQALGRWVDAETHLKAALDSQQDAWISANRALLEGALRSIQGRLASVEILTNINGADVRFNGRSMGTTPMTQAARVAAGTIAIDVTAEGYWPVNRSVVASAGATIRETIDLAPRSGLEKQPPTVELGVVPKPSVHATGAPTRGISPWVYVSGAGALVGVGVGIVGILIANGDVNDYNARCAGANPPAECGGTAAADAGRGGRAVTAVGFVAAGLLATTAVVLFFALDDQPAPEAAVQTAQGLGSWVGVDERGIVLRHAF